MTQPTPQAQPPAGAGQADLASIAADTIRESNDAVPPPPGTPQGQPAPAGPIDRWGRTFDPLKHLTTADGRPRLRAGKTLIARKGMEGSGAAPKAAPTGHAGGSLDLEAAGLGGPGDGDAVPPGAGADQVQLNPDLAGLKAKAEADAALIREGIEALCRLLAGEKGELKPDAVRKLDTRWENALLENAWALPIGALTLAVWESGRNLWTAGTTEEGRARAIKAVDWLTGKPSRPRDGKPIQQEQTQKPEPEAPTVKVPKSERFGERRLEDVSL